MTTHDKAREAAERELFEKTLRTMWPNIALGRQQRKPDLYAHDEVQAAWENYRRSALSAEAAKREPVAWIERRFLNGELVHETLNREPMPAQQQEALARHYDLEIVPLGPLAAPVNRSISEQAASEAMPTDEQIAEMFHRVYEELAPFYGYETRAESRKPWAEVPEQNRLLMMGVIGRVRALLASAPSSPAQPLDATALRTEEYDVICDRRDLFDFLRAAWRDGQDHHGEMDETERWDLATQHAKNAIQGWATLRHVRQEAQPLDEAKVRNQALEEAAEICDAAAPAFERFEDQRAAGSTARKCAAGIRDLKSSPHQEAQPAQQEGGKA